MAEAAEYSMSFSQMTLVDWLDDLTVRFLLNLPPAELSSMPRLCFQVEEAQWFYEDFIRPANPQLPSLNLRQFCLTLFQHCPLLSGFDASQHLAAYQQFIDYKVRVPVRGAILMDSTMEKVLLVRGWKKGANWSFPRGKINKDEDDLVCAMREVYEETGFDIDSAGLVQPNEENGRVKSIEVKLRDQEMKLFVFRGIPLDTHFEPRTRKEIGKIQWYNVKDLPGFKKHKGGPGYGQGEAHANKFYMVAPFLAPLKKWINHQRRKDATELHLNHHGQVPASHALNAAITEDEGDIGVESAPEYAANVSSTSAHDLKKLLSIGQASTSTLAPFQAVQNQENVVGHTTDLMSLLRGSQQSDHLVAQNANLMHTPQTGHPEPQYRDQHSPMVSYSPYPQSHPHHLHNPSNPMAVPDSFGARHGHLSQAFDRAINQPSNMFPLHNRPQIPTDPSHLPIFTSFNQQSQHGSLHYGPGIRTTADNVQARQTPFNTVNIEPRVPEASKLPAPRLNAHSIKLLDAFKGANEDKSASNTHDMNSTGQRAGFQQQAALLNLFKQAPPKDTIISADASETKLLAPISKPVSTGKSEQHPREKQPGPAADEKARILPYNPKQKSTVPRDLPSITDASGNSSANPETQKSVPFSQGMHSSPASPRQIPKSENSKDNRVASQQRKVEQGSPTSSVSILQRPSSRHADGASKVQHKKSPSNQSSSGPQFSILQRPGSFPGKIPRLSTPQSPLRHEAHTASFQPQVLKRPTNGANENIISDLEKPASIPDVGSGKTDHLLALFGKSSISAPEQTKTRTPEPQANSQQRDNLLNLFNASAVPRTTAPTTMTPPPAPQLAPERNPPRLPNTARQQNQQHLLNLFNLQTSVGGSPNTPISPFTLGTPITRIMPGSHQIPDGAREPRSRLGSVTSMVSSGTNSGRQTPTPSNATPTEAKGVLLDYLNGVVKEGYRGSKRGGS